MESIISALATTTERLVVFPEMGVSGYYFGDRDKLWKLSEPVPGGTITHELETMASANNCYIISGLPESEGKALYNCVVWLDLKGISRNIEKSIYGMKRNYCMIQAIWDW